jgi:hypothetical protein
MERPVSVRPTRKEMTIPLMVAEAQEPSGKEENCKFFI